MHKKYGGMSFKDLTAFNLVILGKQGWKFQTDPDSLVTNLFKARHFPRSDYLNAKISHNPSFVWRSIISARRIVRSGARWKIGNDINILIFEAPWLRNGGSISAVGQPSEVLQHARVHSLIDHNVHGWNCHLIHSYFDNDIVQEILGTPLFHQVEEDDMVWKAEKNGQYSVRSVYCLCIEDVADNSHLHRIGNWDNIWRLKVPPKVKNLMWRICWGCLPTRARLLDKGVNCTSLCGLCDKSYEDTIHVLFDCPRARNVWKHSLLWSKVYSVMRNNNTVADIIFSLLRELTQDQSQMFATLLWSIRKSCNLRVWKNKTKTIQAIVERARFLLYDWQSTNREK